MFSKMLLTCVLMVACAADNFDLRKPAQDLFTTFQTVFNKTYADDQESRFRFLVFKDNLKSIATMNVGEAEEVFGVTKFSDLTPAEFKTTYLGYRRLNETRDDDEAEVHPVPAGYTAAATVDWRTKGAVTPVKDQGQCGSCWAYSATEEIESEWILAGNKMTEFSPQQIISCDKVDLGCNGGDTATAYAYVEKAKGLALESKYPSELGKTSSVTGKNGKCKHIAPAGGKPAGFTYATKPCTQGACKKQNLKTLAANVASKAPASICVNAGAWQNYVKGTMTVKKCGGFSADDLDHCVQLVGYTAKYWIVRNSWNTDWGLKGYIHLQAGKNTCGIANEATFVSFAK